MRRQGAASCFKRTSCSTAATSTSPTSASAACCAAPLLQASLLSKANTGLQVGQERVGWYARPCLSQQSPLPFLLQVLLVVAAGAQLAWPSALPLGWGTAAVDALSWAVIGTTVASGADYLVRGGLSAMPQRSPAATITAAQKAALAEKQQRQAVEGGGDAADGQSDNTGSSAPR